jgi:DNA-binding NarL/FixJ family response regulator
MDTHSKIRVVLADDHPALQVGLRVLLNREPDIRVVGEAHSGVDTLRLVATCKPDVLVLDCQLPDLEGGDIAARIQSRQWSVKVIALSAYDDDRYIASMLSSGAVGYLLKSEAPKRIAEAVRAAAQGWTIWTDEQMSRAECWQTGVARVLQSLTPREVEVLSHIADGLSNKEIATQLSITVRTVDFHVSNLLRKLDVISRVEAAVWAEHHLEKIE